MTAQQFTDDLLLAALDRAARHSSATTQTATTSHITAHLAISTRSGAWRQVRRQLGDLVSAGLIEHSRHKGTPVWGLTHAGRERLATIIVVLPESPQHRAWREARTAATQGIDRLLLSVRDGLDDAMRLLGEDPPATSEAWFELGERLRRDCRRVGTATYCLGEWAEPEDARADIDDRIDPGDERFDADERAKRRFRRAGRRDIRLWDTPAPDDLVVVAEHNRLLVALGQAIRQLRAEQNLSAKQLAVTAGLTPTRLDAIEAGRHDPHYDVLLALAHGLSIKPAELIGRAQASMIAQRSPGDAVPRHGRTLTVNGVVLRLTLDIVADALMITLTPINELDREALEAATIDLERIFDEHVASGASASANFQNSCVEVAITLDAITVGEIAHKLTSLEERDPGHLGAPSEKEQQRQHPKASCTAQDT